jgi:hypothetical protein
LNRLLVAHRYARAYTHIHAHTQIDAHIADVDRLTSELATANVALTEQRNAVVASHRRMARVLTNGFVARLFAMLLFVVVVVVVVVLFCPDVLVCDNARTQIRLFVRSYV